MDSTSDIVVIGAGIIGCAVAFELARRGASVQVVDDRPAGMGATQAAAGVLAPYIEGRHNKPLLGLAARSLALYDAFVGHVTSSSGLRVAYQRSGTLDVALTAEAMKALEAAAHDLTCGGVTADLLEARAVRDEEPQLAVHAVGGLAIPSHGYVSAPELTCALAAAARSHGARVVEDNRVHRIARAGNDLVVETANGSLTGNGVVLAAGSWSGQVEVEGVAARAPIRPVRGQLLHLAWAGPPLRRVTWGDRCYLVPWDDGTVLVGATVEDVGFDERTTVAGVRDLMEAACELVPHASNASLTSARVGLRPASQDLLPVIGPSGVVPNLMYATGHYRNGVLLAPLTAQLVANAMLDHVLDPMLEQTTPLRFGKM